MAIEQAAILCGGKGERLGDALRYCPTVDIPKALVEVAGKPFITYAIAMLKGIGMKAIWVLTKETQNILDWCFLSDGITNVLSSSASTPIREEISHIPFLNERFLLLNGDSFPIMDWRAFVDTSNRRVAMKVIGRDAGVAIVSLQDIVSGLVDPLNMRDMAKIYENYIVLGGLHVGTPAGLHRARQFMDMVSYGQ